MSRMRWEYRVVTFRNHELSEIQPDLTRWGAAGWELVSVAPTTKWVGFNELVLVFKRLSDKPIDREAEPRPEEHADGWI